MLNKQNYEAIWLKTANYLVINNSNTLLKIVLNIILFQLCLNRSAK